MKHFRLFLFVLIFSEFIYSQSTDLKFNHIGLEQGLTQSGVYAIVQDAQGFMWFGTQAGLNRYDGYTIKTFKHNPLDSSSISVNYISNLLCDSDGNLWIGTDHSGVDLYITSENRFIHFVHLNDNPASLSDNRVTKIFEDSNMMQILLHTNSIDYKIKKLKVIRLKVQKIRKPTFTCYGR